MHSQVMTNRFSILSPSFCRKLSRFSLTLQICSKLTKVVVGVKIVVSKKDNSEPVSRVLFPIAGMPVIYLRTTSPLPSIVLPSDSSGPLSLCVRRFTWTFNSRSAQHRHHCRPGRLLPHLLTLTFAGGLSLLHYQTLADLFLLGSEMPCVARTFLSFLAATSRFTVSFWGQRYK